MPCTLVDSYTIYSRLEQVNCPHGWILCCLINYLLKTMTLTFLNKHCAAVDYIKFNVFCPDPRYAIFIHAPMSFPKATLPSDVFITQLGPSQSPPAFPRVCIKERVLRTQFCFIVNTSYSLCPFVPSRIELKIIIHRNIQLSRSIRNMLNEIYTLYFVWILRSLVR